MKLLILAMSCNLEKYLNEEQAVRNTWGKDIDQGKYPGIEYFFYTSGDKEYVDKINRKIYVQCGDTLDDISIKTRKALILADKIFDYDYILITNLSTFLNLKLIYNFINSDLINENYIYGGDYIQALHLMGFFRGNFILLSKKYVLFINNYEKIIRKENDVDISIVLLGFFECDKDFLLNLRQVECIKDLKDFNTELLNKSFYCSLKSRGKEFNFEIANDFLYNWYKDIIPYENLSALVYPIKYVDTVVGRYKIEKICD